MEASTSSTATSRSGRVGLRIRAGGSPTWRSARESSSRLGYVDSSPFLCIGSSKNGTGRGHGAPSIPQDMGPAEVRQEDRRAAPATCSEGAERQSATPGESRHGLGTIAVLKQRAGLCHCAFRVIGVPCHRSGRRNRHPIPTSRPVDILRVRLAQHASQTPHHPRVADRAYHRFGIPRTD